MPPGRLEFTDKPATAQLAAAAAAASASGSSPRDNSAVAVAGVDVEVSASPPTSSGTAAAHEGDAAVGSAAAPGSSFDDVCATRRACVVASLRRYVEEWDRSDQEHAEAMIVSLLTYDGPLELGTIVTYIVDKVVSLSRGERILDCLSAHTFDMTPVRSVHCNVWWSAGGCTFMVGPVGMAAFGLVPTWVEKLLSHLRVSGRLGELTNEVAVAASVLSSFGTLSTSAKVERLTKVLPMLLAAGCDANAKAGGFTALQHVASAWTREEVDDEEKAKWYAPVSEMDALLEPLCVLLCERGAQFDVRGDYGDGHAYDSARKYRGWTPPSGTKSNDSITLPHPTATALEIFTARGWLRCMDAILQTRARSPSRGECVCGGGV